MFAESTPQLAGSRECTGFDGTKGDQRTEGTSRVSLCRPLDGGGAVWVVVRSFGVKLFEARVQTIGK